MLVHGLGEHSGRYAHVVDYLNQRGYAVCALDFAGHGQSAGKRAYFESLDQPCQQLAEAIEQFECDDPLFIYAHSLGTLAAIRYALSNQERLAGMILSGTPLHYARMIPGPVFQLVKLLNKAVPGLPISPNLGTSVLSRDATVVDAYNSDPLVFHGWLPVRLIYYLLAESRTLCKQLGDLRLPLLIAHGVEDRLCPMAGSQTLFRGASSKDRSLKLFGGFRHEIHNEPDREEVLVQFADWLDAHC